ncbi:neutral zinc metallopeptidase [Nonomuraea sp. 3-1Str]|uniref:neutral zinc metallopeptidase n=1 Tax=Nonomuraea sp. 3-1Str TaxID=2929801 RepID=UPI0028646AE4|nr:neutral zinc metallopeptidase [Nonomuraea sp. 3-1Str]MDR8411005.1 neutral zinc metallopeptidase [Nonomuraea sp. 3-1Str]
MRIPLVAASVCVIAGLVTPATAGAQTAAGPAAASAAASTAAQAASGVPHAAAVPPAVLAENRIYRSGTAAPLSCPIPEIREGSAASLKTFHRAMARCADRFWAIRFKAAGLRYTSPRVTITTGSSSVCGRITSNGAQYCPAQRTVAIRIMKRDLTDPFKMNIAHSVAHEWGHHVQQLTGMLDEQNRLYWRSGGSARTVLSHRLEMQAECFAGVFYSAALDSVDPGITWDQWIGAVREAEESKVHGKPRNLAYWQDRGYSSGSAGSCNTWTASSARVS